MTGDKRKNRLVNSRISRRKIIHICL